MFYDKSIDILTIAEGITDENGIYIDGEETVLKSIDSDIQPYSSDLLYRDYGYRAEVTKRIFCSTDSSIDVSTLLQYNTVKYRVEKIIEWDDYIELMVKEV